MNSIHSGLLMMLIASWTSSVIAGSDAESANSGVIHFHGAIVSDSCRVNPQSGVQLQASCYQNGEMYRQTAPMAPDQPQALPLNQGQTEFRWLDRNRKLALVTVKYN